MTVATTYPCSRLIIISGFSIANNCTLGSSITERVE